MLYGVAPFSTNNILARPAAQGFADYLFCHGSSPRPWPKKLTVPWAWLYQGTCKAGSQPRRRFLRRAHSLVQRSSFVCLTLEGRTKTKQATNIHIYIHQAPPLGKELGPLDPTRAELSRCATGKRERLAALMLPSSKCICIYRMQRYIML